MVLLGSPLRDRIPLPIRPWLALAILLLPIISSIVSGIMATQGTGYKIHLTYFLVVYMVYNWAVFLSSAFYWGAYSEVLAFWRAFRFLDILVGLAWFITLRITSILLILPIVILIVIIKPTYFVEHRSSPVLAMILQFRENPIQCFFIFTLVSMMAGFCEETWRYGMFKVASQIVPKAFYDTSGKVGVIFGVSLIFGSAHLYEGFIGVIGTSILGFGLGCIMLYRKSFWEASLAHFFTDASVGFLLFLFTIFKISIPEL